MTYAITFAAITATATLALAGASNAAVTVRVGDLNTANPAHVAVLEARIDRAAHRFCRDHFHPTADDTLGECRRAIRAEVHEKLAARDSIVQVAGR